MPYSHNEFLSSLSPADRNLVEPHLALVPLPNGKVLCDADEEIEQIYFPFSGVVSMVNVLQDGSQVECCTMGHESGFGLLAAQEPVRSFTRDVIQIPGEGAAMSARALRDVADESPSLQLLVRAHNRAMVGFMAQSSACNARHKVETRLCRWLLTCADYVEGDHLPLTQEFIAIMLGVQRTTVTAIAAELQKSRIIHMVRGNVTILNAEALKQRSCECYRVTRGRIDAALGKAVRRPLVNADVRAA